MGPCFAVALLAVVIGSAVGLDRCVVDCSKSNVAHLTADPVNCKNYYMCYDSFVHSPYSFPCEDNKFFDIVSNSCRDYPVTCTPKCEKCSFDCSSDILGKISSPVDCGIYYMCYSDKWVTCPSEEPFFDGSVCQKDRYNCCDCKPRCTAHDAVNYSMVPDPRNCTNYYQCLNEGIPIIHGHCPYGNFDAQLEICSADATCIQPCAW
ncbi:hypothetical protein O3P69_004405 [Scylla paramamosain]|uniref:Chitin-binding type-2 domain-containing protein n=1 Tax=Scylla paramamosain TaxID=85552 RepID=A0AAW0UDD2_SCYPA